MELHETHGRSVSTINTSFRSEVKVTLRTGGVRRSEIEHMRNDLMTLVSAIPCFDALHSLQFIRQIYFVLSD
jgi:hypothetical protein